MSSLWIAYLLPLAALPQVSRGELDSRMSSNGRAFHKGENVDVLVKQLTSASTQLSMDYKDLPHCPLPGFDLSSASNNNNGGLSQSLSGNGRIRHSPYLLLMKQDMYCEQVCVVNMGRSEANDGVMPNNRMVRLIRNNYQQHWLVDKTLPSASVLEDSESIVTSYTGGFPLGFVAPVSFWGHSQQTGFGLKSSRTPRASGIDRAYVYNHVNLKVEYHTVAVDQYQVVRFFVQPYSIAHDIDDADPDDPQADHATNSTAYFLPRPVRIHNPIPSCQIAYYQNSRTRIHTDYELLSSSSVGPQVASGRVLFTYDVVWVETDVKYSDRWNIYLTDDHAVPYRERWTHFCNSLITVVVGSALVLAFIKTWVQHRARYQGLAQQQPRTGAVRSFNVGDDDSSRTASVVVLTEGNRSTQNQRRNSVNDDDDGDESEYDSSTDDDSSAAEDAWREDLERHVFAPPEHFPELLLSLCGLGALIFGTCFLLLGIGASGIPTTYVRIAGGGGSGGIWMIICLASLLVLAPFNGFLTAKLSKAFLPSSHSTSWNSLALEMDGVELATTNDHNQSRDMEGENNNGEESTTAGTQEHRSANGSMQKAFAVALGLVGKADVRSAVRILSLHILFPFSGILLLLTVDMIGIWSKDTPDRPYFMYPLFSLACLLVALLCIFSPLLFMGYGLGMNQSQPNSYSSSTPDSGDSTLPSSSPPPPPQPWYTHPVALGCSGVFPFVILEKELDYLFQAAFFGGPRYSSFGFLLLVLTTSCAVSCVLAALATYTRFSHDNFYAWQWLSFSTGGTVAVFALAHALWSRVPQLTWTGVCIHSLFVIWMSVGWFLAMGFAGVAASSWFLRRLYQSVKVAR